MISIMKKLYSRLAIVSSLLCASSFAGTPDFKQAVAAPPPPADCGVGWYFGLDGGANVYQDFGGEHQLGVIDGERVSIEANHRVGGFGGIKFGYVFGHGPWRWGLEEDYFYNGVNAAAHIDVDHQEVASVSSLLNTGAFMTNAIFRYAPTGCGFQPYILGGLGGWWGETGGDVDFNVNGETHHLGSRDNGGFAFQAGAGIDYYFSPKWSVFTEYKFLDYTNAGGEFNNSNIGQHLVGGGIRIHF